MIRPWKVLARRVLLSRPPWIEVGDERVELPDGRLVEDYPWIRTRDFAIVVAITPLGQVVLERAYKHGHRSVAVALPAGYTEEGESPIDTARRELREETGYEAEEWRSLGSFTVDGNYGLCAEHAFLALGAYRPMGASATPTGDLEDIEVFTASLRDALEMLEGGQVAQLSTAAALALDALALQRQPERR
jgi:8-oxo-dGTP pyrophosphatase MutT (NUDIX family)